MSERKTLAGRLPSLKAALSNKQPAIGVTQGGSSRTNNGAKPAATAGRVKQYRRT